jgi:hypothetical protein
VSAPATLAKFATDHTGTQEMMRSLDGFAREVRFYRELAPEIGLGTPRCYFARYDPTARECVACVLFPNALRDLLVRLLARSAGARHECAPHGPNFCLVLSMRVAMHANPSTHANDDRALEELRAVRELLAPVLVSEAASGMLSRSSALKVSEDRYAHLIIDA